MFNFLTQKFSSIFSKFNNKGQITQGNIDEALIQVKDSLLEADVPYDLVNSFIEKVKSESIGKQVIKSLNPGQQFIKIVYDSLCSFMGNQTATSSFPIPSIIMVLGLQGSGKTTTLAKLAHFLKEYAQKKGKQRNILLASVDYYRPAAIEQLDILAKRVGTSFYRSKYTEPLKAALDIFEHYKKNQYDYLLLDTSGRLHVDTDMIKELKEIDSKLNAKFKILVLDSMTGQESLKVAQAFDQSIGFNGAILTKMDSDTRAGAAFSFRFALKKPILFVGTGEKIDDLEQFHPDRIATRILGMGDVLTLVEKAEKNIKKQEQDDLAKALSSGKFTLQDFSNQIDMVNKIGSLSKIAQYFPGVDSSKLTPDALQKGEHEIKKFKAMISSMTAREKVVPKIIDASRKQRIAKGSGTSVSDVNLLLEKFEQSKQFAKLFKRYGNFKNFFK